MDNTQKEGSDSDWDSTLDFTSPRQVGIGHLPPGINLEVEEESSLSEESDVEDENSLPKDKQIIRNVLKSEAERARAPSPNQKENNLVLAQRQQNVLLRPTEQQRREPPANQMVAKSDMADVPPYNFRESLNTEIETPEPIVRNPPGKDKKGKVYDPDPVPTHRGIQRQQDNTKSVSSWDESDPDERTLREVRSTFQQQKLKEVLKIKEDVSVAEDPAPTARSETTWKSWSKFGKKPSGAKTSQSQLLSTQATPQTPQSSRAQPVQIPSFEEGNAQRKLDVASPSMINVYHQSFQPSTHSEQYKFPTDGAQVDTVQNKVLDEPKKLFVRDEDIGRSVYFFGHGNLHYFEVNEDLEEALLPPVADRVDRVVQRVWQEFFAMLRIMLSIVIWFLVELFRFVARHIFLPLILGIFVTLGDSLIKPLLSALFNGFIQPFNIFLWNVFTGMKHMFSPIGEIMHNILQHISMLLRSVRLFDITWVSGRDSPSHAICNV